MDPVERMILAEQEAEGAGTTFLPSDVEEIYARYREEEDVPLPPFAEAWPVMRGSWYWRKGIADLLTERGWEIVYAMVGEYVAEKRKEVQGESSGVDGAASTPA